MTGKEDGQETRQRLLEAASVVFAEQGFRNGRIRDICARAKANVAAVNYHFGSKRGLYDAVLHNAFFSMTGRDPTEWGVGIDAPCEDRLHGLVRTLLTQMLMEGQAELFRKLITREIMDPTDAIERIIDEGIKPQADILFVIIRELLGDAASEQNVRRCAASIFAQCVFFHFARPVIDHLEFERNLGPSSVDALAEHVTRFSLAAVRELRENGDSKEST